MSQVINRVITPNDKDLRTIFQNPKSYFIDIYQREYKWEEHNVETLLKDIEVRFSLSSRNETEPGKIQSDVKENFEPYFLNTFLTNTTAKNVYIVDGQQRLTTFLLIFMKLYSIIKNIQKSDDGMKTFATKVIEDLIFETDDFGNASKFKIYNENREIVFNAIKENNLETFKPADETQKRIIENFNFIDKYFDYFLKSDGNEGRYDVVKLNYYLTYLLDRLSLVEIKIESPKNVAMIFEVVNDRGLGLKSYEILKGKLIGNLNEKQKEEANKIWTNLQDKYYNNPVVGIDLDDFFKAFFRAKFAESEADYEKFEGKYHYEIYKNEKINKFFGNFEDQDILFERVTNDIKYFAELYFKIRTSYDFEHLIYNELLDQKQQYLLILSNVPLNDVDSDERIHAISKKFDQFHTTLRLLDVYESNAFQKFIYELNSKIREIEIETATSVFDEIFLNYLDEEGFIDKSNYNTISEIYEYSRFKNMRNRWLNFSKYVLMRVDRELSEIIDKPSYTSESLKLVEDRFNRHNRKRHGLHLEHIITNNLQNKQLFTDENGVFDESAFNETRNKLGATLLLKDKQNLSSGADIYKDKVKTYSKSNLIWNEFLVGHVDKVDEKKLPEHFTFESIEPNDTGVFPLPAVEQRQKELFTLIKHIWADDKNNRS